MMQYDKSLDGMVYDPRQGELTKRNRLLDYLRSFGLQGEQITEAWELIQDWHEAKVVLEQE